MKLFTGDKRIILADGNGVQLFFNEGNYTGMNMLGNPTSAQLETIMNIIEIAQFMPCADTTSNGLYNGSDHVAAERALDVQ